MNRLYLALIAVAVLVPTTAACGQAAFHRGLPLGRIRVPPAVMQDMEGIWCGNQKVYDEHGREVYTYQMYREVRRVGDSYLVLTKVTGMPNQSALSAYFLYEADAVGEYRIFLPGGSAGYGKLDDNSRDRIVHVTPQSYRFANTDDVTVEVSVDGDKLHERIIRSDGHSVLTYAQLTKRSGAYRELR